MRLWGNSGHVESTFGCNLRVTLGTFLAPIYLKLIKRANFKVKLAFKELAKDNSRWRILTRHPLRPSSEERFFNPRSRSAKMRVIEFL